MSIKAKLILILLIGYGLSTGIDFLVQRKVILNNLLELERHEYEKDMQRCTEAIRREIYHLGIFASDWSSWDDTYAFARDATPDYVNANFLLPTFQTNRLNLIVVVARDGQVRFAKRYDPVGKILSDPPGFSNGPLPLSDPRLLHNDPEGHRDGIYLAPSGPMLLVARPILPTLGVAAGPPMGTLIMGRLLNDALVEDIREQTHVSFDVLPANGPLSPEETALVKLTADGSFSEYGPSSATRLTVYTTLNDIAGGPAILIRAHFPRDLLQRGQSAMDLDSISAALGAIVVFILVVITAHRTIVQPLQDLVGHVHHIGRRESLQAFEGPERVDEIGVLAREFNQMVCRLQEDDLRKAEAEAKLRKSEARLSALLDSAPDPILVVDAAGRVEKANHAVDTVLGLSPETLEGKHLLPYFDGDGIEELQVLLDRLDREHGRQEQVATFELTYRHPNGYHVPVYATAATTLLDASPVLILILRDLTQFKIIQEKLLEHRNLASIGEMSASLAHDIRNPLAGIRSVAELLRIQLGAGTLEADYMNEIVKQVDRVESTVRTLLQFAKTYVPRLESVNLCVLLNDLHFEYKLRPECAHVAFRYEGPEDVCVEADPHLLREVLANLWTNACQAMTLPGEACWTVQALPDAWKISLQDNGPGIPPALLPRLFEPFFTTRTTGTGLGLAICRRILEAQGATINAANRPGGGAVVSILFPAKGIACVQTLGC